MEKILVVENQYTHFEKIQRHLANNGYDVFPSSESGLDGFRGFIDLIRVYLNERYGGLDTGSRRRRAFAKIVVAIRDANPDLIILDHVLLGNHDGKKGTFLANALRETGISVPIVFLSRSEKYEQETISEYESIADPKDWVQKGYAGMPTLDEGFFVKEVIQRFKPLWGKSRFLKIYPRIESLRSSSPLINHPDEHVKTQMYELLGEIESKKYVPEPVFGAIMAVENVNEPTLAEILTIVGANTDE